MSQTSREIVRRCLEFNSPERIPRDMWLLPWFETKYPEQTKQVKTKYPSDFGGYPDSVYNASAKTSGNPFAVGEYVDDWGCVFHNVHAGIIGEVKKPIIENWSEAENYQAPYEVLPTDYDAAIAKVNDYCETSDKFVMGGCCPRPWERIQFILGTENAMMEMLLNKEEFKKLLNVIHAFYVKELTFWAQTDVDGLTFMDDWGSQNRLLIRPAVWRELFKPLYQEYCDIAHKHGKKIFMHSDGYIMDIYPDLIEIGVDAVNSQLFCMDMDKIAQIAKWKITFWGEIDRQHILTSKNTEDGRAAVRKVADALYDPAGGIIAQFELGPGANPEMAVAIFDEWEKVQVV